MFLALHFSPDARTLSASVWGDNNNYETNEILCWEKATGTLRLRLQAGITRRGGGEVENHALTFIKAPDVKQLAAAGPRGIRVWNAATGKEVRRFGGRDVVGQSAVFSPDGKYLVAGLDNGGIRFWNAATGTVLHDAVAHTMQVTCLAFADDGKTLVSGSLDGTAIAWDLDHLLKAPLAATVESEKLWASLGQTDAEKASHVMQAFIAQPKETLAFFQARLRPVPTVAPQRLIQLLADLQSAQYGVRQRATEELEQLGGQARPALEKALDASPALEARRRIEALVTKLEPPFADPGLLRTIRALEVLERIGTLDARVILEQLAAGGRGHRVTEDARDALDRLTKQPSAR